MNNLAIFDLDGTLTPQRAGSCGPFEKKLLPNVTEMLWFIRNQGWECCIASNQSARRDKDDLMAHIKYVETALHIHRIMYATEKAYKKPNPYMLNLAMSIYGVPPRNTIFVGDAETDEQAAIAAGIRFAYPTPAGWNTVLRAACPDARYWMGGDGWSESAEDLDELAEIIKEFRGRIGKLVFYPYETPSIWHSLRRRGYTSVYFGTATQLARGLFASEKDYLAQRCAR